MSIVEELKAHEKRYTTILVIVFILLIIGFFSYFLSVNSKKLITQTNTINHKYLETSTSSELFTITNEKKKYTVNIDNNTNNVIKYKVLLEEDINSKEICKCNSNIDTNLIKYTINNKTNSLSNNIIYEGELDKNKATSIDVSIWLESNDHYHGYFRVIKIDE